MGAQRAASIASLRVPAFDHPKTWENLQRLSDAEFVKRMNLDSVSNAERFVVAGDNRHAGFIEKHLTDPPANA